MTFYTVAIMQDETLRNYRVLDLPAILSASPATSATIAVLASQVKNDPVELLGEAPVFFVLPLYARLRWSSQEIIFRPKPETHAVVVMSMASEGIRPNDVINLSDWWSETELASFEKAWKNSEEEAEVRLDVWWDEALSGGHEAPIRVFLRRLYAAPPPSVAARLVGDAPLLPSLLAAEWFLSSKTPRVEYQSLVLKSL